MEALRAYLQGLIASEVITDDDRLLLAVAAEIEMKLALKVAVPFHKKALVKFTPAQAFALRIIYNDYYQNPTTQLGNILHQLSNTTNQVYQ